MFDDPYLRLQTVGRCRILSRLGEGGMGCVYKGYHEDLDLEVAVKFLHSHLTRQSNSDDRFLREARLAARLNHPAIVRVFDCGEQDGFFYIVMEYVEGTTLEQQIQQQGSLTTTRALQIAKAVGQALAEAWQQVAVIHRDVKPANILITPHGQVKLADLGLAKMVATKNHATSYTSAGVALGTPRYMSPEQFIDARDVDLRSDMFALGATLHHMLSGQPPFRGENFIQIYKEVTDGDPRPLPDSIPIEVQELVFRMLSKSPADRFQTYGELLDGLETIQCAIEDTRSESTPTMPAEIQASVIPEVRLVGRALRPARPKENRVLLVVDIQNDFCPAGALAVPEGDEVVPLINRLSRRFAHVVLTQDWHCEDHLSFASSHPGKQPLERIELPYGQQILWPDHCVQGTAGADFHRDLEVANCELIIRKGYHREIDSYSAFFENDRQTPTGLAGYLRERGLSRIFLTGLATDFCVAYTALDARRLGFEVTVIEEACRGIDVDGSLEAAWQQMLEAGVLRA